MTERWLPELEATGLLKILFIGKAFENADSSGKTTVSATPWAPEETAAGTWDMMALVEYEGPVSAFNPCLLVDRLSPGTSYRQEQLLKLFQTDAIQKGVHPMVVEDQRWTPWRHAR